MQRSLRKSRAAYFGALDLPWPEFEAWLAARKPLSGILGQTLEELEWHKRIETAWNDLLQRVVITLAAERVEREQGRYAVRIDELVPEYLSGISTDPFTAQPYICPLASEEEEAGNKR